MGETDDFPQPRDAGPDRRDNVASAGLDPDTWDELETWRTDRRLKRSEATRQLLRAGLDAETGGIGGRIAAAAILVLITGYPTVAAATGNLRLAVVFIALVVTLEITWPRIEDATARIRSKL